MTINILPDEALLEIFGFYMAHPLPPPSHKNEDAWHTLVHVCRRWRYVVFGSPRRLNLRLLCMNRKLMKTLDIWPELPIVIHLDSWRSGQLPSVTDVISVLKRHDRVCKIFIDGAPTSLLEELATISEPFPALIELELAPSFGEDAPTFPDSFLGGSAPTLQSLNLWDIRFPAIGKLLLSTHNLVTLSLGSISRSPESMVAILSGLTRLKTLYLQFHHVETLQFWTHGASQRPPAFPHVVLPALTNFAISGYSRYLEDIVSRIDAPLDRINVTFFDEFEFDIPLFRDFLGRTKILNASHRADISYSSCESRITLFQRKGDVDFKVLNLLISCLTRYSHILSLARICSSFLPPLPRLEHLSISASDHLPPGWQHEVEKAKWVELLRHFTAVKDLVLNKLAVLSVDLALQELIGKRVIYILPALQNISLEDSQSPGPVPEGITKFITAREFAGRPVIVHHRATVAVYNTPVVLQRLINAVRYSFD